MNFMFFSINTVFADTKINIENRSINITIKSS